MRVNMTSPASMAGVVSRRLNALKPLSPVQLQHLDGLGDRLEAAAPGAMLQSDGDGPMRPSFILSGWACRKRLLPDGRRQIFSLLIPGDALGFCLEPSPLSSADIVALTKVVLAAPDWLKGESLTGGLSPPVSHASAARDAGLFADHMRRSVWLEDGLLLDHVVRLGRQTAYERTAHLLLELDWRLALIGQTENHRFTMPLTQEVLADFLGLSIVHVNRTLQQLRRERMIELSGSQVALLDAAQLALIADYQPPILPWTS
jgi:CRP-like cAMP-binding protein